ncbi:MAG TPA: hypothetical protein VJN64_15765 [Terriglobales bacterium]|nr:hypothetical protein [Terriglobales bacterium]
MKRFLTFAFAFLFSGSMALMAQSSDPNASQPSTAPSASQSSDNSAQPAQADQQTSKAEKKEEKAEKKEAKAAAKGKDMRLTGWVKEDNGKVVFVNDKDKHSWDIANPDAVKGHEGHHVKVRAKLDETNHSVTIDKLTMMKKSKQSGDMKSQNPGS